MSEATCLPCRIGKSHTFHDGGEPNLAYAYEGTEPPVQDSAHEDNWWRDIPVVRSRDLCPHEGTPCKHCGDGDPDEAPLDLMHQAEQLVYGDRQSSYGHPYDDYSRTAGMWSSFLGIEITPAQAALMMVLLKISRERNRPKDDNIVDAHGYLLCYGRIQGREDSD